MADDQFPPQGLPEIPEPAAPDWSAWSRLWQMPALLIASGLIVAAMVVAMRRAPKNDFDGAMDQTRQLIVDGSFEEAANLLNDVIEPNLEQATVSQRARFHALVGDWVYYSQEASGAVNPQSDLMISQQYRQATEIGSILSPPRLEQWANVLIRLGDVEGARRRLAELEALAVREESGDDARVRRNRVLRRLVEQSLLRQDLPVESLLAALGEYRADRMLRAADERWAVARQAELRIQSGQPQAAIDHLMVDMRRLERHVEAEGAPVSFAELYGLLGRAYYDLGESDHAEYHLTAALEQFDGPDAAAGDAHLLLGHILASRGELDEALARMDLVVRDFVDTRSYLGALLSRAELESIIGEHASSFEDFQALRAALARSGPQRLVTPERVAQSLCDRHDAALAMRKLDLALQYALMAETYFEPSAVPPDVLVRIAATSRHQAEALMEQGRALLEEESALPVDVDPAIRHEANVNYRRAGDYYVRHARALTTEPDAGDQWAESLWWGADSYDRAGRRDLAITHFQEYLGGRSTDDARWAEVTFRLAQAFHAELDFESAAHYYEELIQEHPRSQFATRSHVPLARVYLALGRTPEAERQLQEVLVGGHAITPEAMDYRDGLIELGKIYHDSGDYVAAIERLEEAAQRYPDDPRRPEILFRLADAHRGRALELTDQRDAEPNLPPAEARHMNTMLREHLVTARGLFAQVCDFYDQVDPRRLDRYQQDQRRLALRYQADCSFDLGEYEEAIRVYDAVARKYADHHSSINALIQIYNCHVALGDMERARAANARAKNRVNQLPDEAFEQPDSLMDRAAWERWLANSPIGETAVASGG